MATITTSLQTKAIDGPINPYLGMRITRRTIRKADAGQILQRKRLCWSSAAKRYSNKVEMKNGTIPMPRSCIAGIAGKYFAPSASRKIGSDHAVKKAAKGKLMRAKNFKLV